MTSLVCRPDRVSSTTLAHAVYTAATTTLLLLLLLLLLLTKV
jgi:hypothetical protein